MLIALAASTSVLLELARNLSLHPRVFMCVAAADMPLLTLV